MTRTWKRVEHDGGPVLESIRGDVAFVMGGRFFIELNGDGDGAAASIPIEQLLDIIPTEKEKQGEE